MPASRKAPGIALATPLGAHRGDIADTSPTSQPYNGNNQPLVYNPPDVLGLSSDNTRFAYDLDHHLDYITLPGGEIIDPEYDAAGRLRAVLSPSGIVTTEYSTTGKIETVTAGWSGNPSLSYGYDGALPTSLSLTVGGVASGYLSWDQDNAMRTTIETIKPSSSSTSAHHVINHYDSDSRLWERVSTQGRLWSSFETHSGFMSQSTVENSGNTASLSVTMSNIDGTHARSSYGEVDWLKYTSSTVTNPLFEEKITSRDGFGRIKTREERVLPLSGLVQVTTYEYTYDGAGRLWQVKENGTLVREYGYDANGNRTSTNTYANGVQTHSFTGVYDAQDRMTSFETIHGQASYQYDNNGRLSTKTRGGLTTTYDYDVFGNLRSVTLPSNAQISYTIDPANRRVVRAKPGLPTERLVFVGLHPVAQLTDDGSDWKRHFVYSSRGHVPDIMYEKTTSGVDVYRVVTDHLGSLRMVVKLDGSSTPNVVQRMSYDEWGNVVQDDLSNNAPAGYTRVPFGYAGGLYDRDTGLVRFGARDYDAESGRWTAKDPLGFGGGDSDVYAYAANDPVNLIDTNGQHPYETFPSAWDAAVDALSFYHDVSVRENKEYAGIIYMDVNGGYHYTIAEVGDWHESDAMSPLWMDPGREYWKHAPNHRIVGSFHTHAAHGPKTTKYGDEHFSSSDLNNASTRPNERGCPSFTSYLGTPDGRMGWVTPKKSGSTYLPVGPSDALYTEPGFLPHY